jgi:hypothetical protein
MVSHAESTSMTRDVTLMLIISTTKFQTTVRARTRREGNRRWKLQLRSKGTCTSACAQVSRKVDRKDSEELAMYEWNGTILGPPHSAYENRIFSLSIYCGDKYPGQSCYIEGGQGADDLDVPPLVKFESKINLPCVEPSGLVCLLLLWLGQD